MTTGSIAGESITESLIAANRAAAERERLEREVVEAAKAFYLQKGEREWQFIELESAIESLIDFESNQREK